MTARVVSENRVPYVLASVAEFQSIGLLMWWPKSDQMVKLVFDTRRAADFVAKRINDGAGPLGQPLPRDPNDSLTVRYGRMTPPQYKIAARIDRGADVRAWDIHPTTLWAMVQRGIVECLPATCRLILRG